MGAEAKPTDDTIALVGFLLGRWRSETGSGWYYADEIRHAVKRLGFRMPSSQWTVARLTAMTKESCPRFEARMLNDVRQYRVTGWAATGLSNQWRGFMHRPLSELPHPAKADRG